MISIGSRLQNFEVIRSLGAGGMSEVYLVRDNLDRLYALKVLSARLTGDDAFRERFKLEAKVMASLSHPNIIGLHSYFEEQGSYCLVMEYLEGGSLKDVIKRTGPIPEARALPIFRQMAEALAHAHSQGIIHRDVKPSNILISADGQYKLGDFGIARMQESEGLTRTGSRMGTLIYMSPEQIMDSKHVDAKTDVYSLGVTLYEMLTGRAPYDETTESDYIIMDRIVRQDLPDPRTIYPHISQSTLNLLKRAIRRDPARRPQFHQLLNGAPSAPAPGPEVRVIPAKDKPPRRQPEPEEEPLPLPDTEIQRDDLVFVQGGDFYMGSDKGNEASALRKFMHSITGDFNTGSDRGNEGGQPGHRVRVLSFYIGKYQVTQAQWLELMDHNPSRFIGNDLPVEQVSWFDAVDFCNRLSRLEGLKPCYSGSGNDIICDWSANGYRLPTEAEWEFAARGGKRSRGHVYSGSNEIGRVAWYNDNSDYKTHKVGTKAPNELGIHDMSGNVWEWCWDWHSDSHHSSSPQNNPTGPETGECRVLRGGGWNSSAFYSQLSNRLYFSPSGGRGVYGFRLCRSVR